ncbi:putative mitochondrial carrier [Phaeomoniella chlamydospora]|uniref:Putative mitochondrial carrier n=1 Tax=Phaeomoniella chlamydospora TaxID=158046 RepID=A0A0G2GAU5_PHACM|nr:putative mitochondrial carrier [Phaeomoniella chlamydospora]
MSTFVADASEAQHQSLSRSEEGYRVGGGQNHDRIRIQSDEMAGTRTSVNDASGEVSVSQRMTSAILGSVLTSLLATPLDVVRVRLQSQSTPSSSATSRFAAHPASFQKLPADLGVTACCREVFWVGDNAPYCLAGPSQSLGGHAALNASDCAVEETQRRTFTSTLDGLRKIAKNEGPTTLWRGLSPTLAMAVPANVIYFTGYDWLRFSPTSPINRVVRDSYSPLVAGSVARVAAALVVSPIEMFRTHIRTRAHHESSAEPFSQQKHMTTFVDSFVSGTVSGATAALITTPFDVGKTRQQVYRHQGDEKPLSESAQRAVKSQARAVPEEMTMPRFLFHILKTEGASGLFKGWAARCLKVAPSCGIMISSYELGKKWARVINEHKDQKKEAL